ncbi:hypothetical protein Cni_G29487 [Canna indica]|uniref:Endonuclease/exonuclease/phosphatase domain-containing protein n=1 Tax=Canna indica TaxID=4628 RepID=A0AAQ3L4H3_9LILI|nr:hypothetical protein Cni_G29487 [Canna indica]
MANRPENICVMVPNSASMAEPDADSCRFTIEVGVVWQQWVAGEGAAPGPQQAERDDGGEDNTGTDASFEMDPFEEHSTAEGMGSNHFTATSDGQNTTPSGLRSHSAGHLSAGYALRRKAVAFATSPAAGIPRGSRPISAAQSDRGNHHSPPLGEAAGVCALWKSDSNSSLAFHRSDLPPVPPFGNSESNAQDLVAGRGFGLSQDLLSDIKLKIKSYTILVLNGQVTELLAVMACFGRVVNIAILGVDGSGQVFFFISDPQIKRHIGGFIYDPLKLVVNGFEWTRVPAQELVGIDYGLCFDQPPQPAHEPSLVRASVTLGPNLKANLIEIFHLDNASPVKLGKVYKRKNKLRKAAMVRRSSRIVGKFCKSPIQSATLIKTARNEGTKNMDSVTPMGKKKSDRLGSFVSHMGNALDLAVLQDIEALGFECAANAVKVVRDNRCSLFFLSETKLNACSRKIVRQLSGFHSFDNFRVINANGLSGKLLALWDSSIWSCTNYIIGEWSIQLFLKHRLSDFSFLAVGVYGPPNRTRRVSFLQELRQIFISNHGPILAVGHFNITLHSGERLNYVGNAVDSRRFSKLIANTGLVDFLISGNLYSWTNNQQPPALAKLDRILINNILASSFPMSVASSGNRRLSDHNPLIWNSSSQIESMKRHFRIEVGWLNCDQFSNIIHAGLAPHYSLSCSPRSASPIGRWISLWKPLRKTIMDWDKLRRASWCKLRVETESRISALNSLADSGTINDAELEELKRLKGVLDKS